MNKFLFVYKLDMHKRQCAISNAESLTDAVKLFKIKKKKIIDRVTNVSIHNSEGTHLLTIEKINCN